MKFKSILYLLTFLIPVISYCQETPMEIPLWPNGAPGFENRRNEPTKAKDWWIKNIHNPSITVYPAPEGKLLEQRS